MNTLAHNVVERAIANIDHRRAVPIAEVVMTPCWHDHLSMPNYNLIF
jgi:hypothetical protein